MTEKQHNEDREISPNATVKISKEQFSIYDLKRQYDQRKKVILAPNFQRENIWNPQQQSELVESVLMGIPIPILYFFEEKDGKRQVVDGRQRLNAFFEFMENKFPLESLKILKEHNNKYFENLEPLYQGIIEDYQLLICVIQPPTSEAIKFEIFERVNRGSTQLNSQEMRNALYQGKATILLNRLVELDCFKQATAPGIKGRMKDKHIVLRFLSFYMLYENWLGDIEYKSNMNDFLANTMKFINQSSDDKVADLVHIFELSMRQTYNILGTDGFRFVKKGLSNKPITMALFEIIAYLFTTPIKFANAKEKKQFKKEIEEKKIKFVKSGTFLTRIDTVKNIEYRFNEIKELKAKL